MSFLEVIAIFLLEQQGNNKTSLGIVVLKYLRDIECFVKCFSLLILGRFKSLYVDNLNKGTHTSAGANVETGSTVSLAV